MAPHPRPGTDDLTADLYVALGRLVRSLRQHAPASEIGPGGVSTLATLDRRGPMRVGALAQAEGVAAASMTRIVTVLEGLRLARRAPDPTDGRAQVVAVTPAGTRLLTGGQEAKLAALRSRIDALPDDDHRCLLAALPALRQLGGVTLVDR